jgi:hypothetical protein
MPPVPTNTSDAKFTFPAVVPGDLLTDLETAGLIDDPLFEFNFKNATLWANYTWIYSTPLSKASTFFADVSPPSTALTLTSFYSTHTRPLLLHPHLLLLHSHLLLLHSHLLLCTHTSLQLGPADDVLLVFDGIKMGATVSLGGKKLGVATDQFLRYNYSVGDILRTMGSSAAPQLEVKFNEGVSTDGRFMACTGGWDWGPYSNTYEGTDHTFSYGIWKRVYLVKVAAAAPAISHVSPYVFYNGGHATKALVDGQHDGFTLSVVTTLVSSSATSSTAPMTGTLTATGTWGTPAVSATTSVKITTSNSGMRPCMPLLYF